MVLGDTPATPARGGKPLATLLERLLKGSLLPMVAVVLPVLQRLPASDECDRAYGHERKGAIHASSCCRTHCVPRRCRGESGGLRESQLQSTVRGVLRYL